MKASATVVIHNEHGLHVRPSTQFMALANGFRSAIQVTSPGGAAADGKSVLELLGLGAGQGDQLEIAAEGDDAEAAVSSLADLVNGRFGGLE